MLKTKLLGATAAAEALAIEDVFSIYFHNGTSATQTITNGIDLAGEGGLVWIKSRTAARAHMLFDTERGVHKYLMSQSTNAEATASTSLTAFNANGFTLGSDSTGDVNYTGNGGYASWTFRKAPRFFDVVTYTGNGVAGRQIAHNLGVKPGCIIVKRTDGAGNWAVYHEGIGATKFLDLNSTNRALFSSMHWDNTEPNDSTFTVYAGPYVNEGGQTYVAYLFAHDPLGPSGDGSDGLIACGSYTGNGSTNGPEVDLGWEPQWVLIKQTSTSGDDWFVVDSMRGFNVGGTTAHLYPNGSAQEFTTDAIEPRATGFKLVKSYGAWNSSGSNYIYIAIRRGPMREPTSGTEVYEADYNTGSAPSYISNFPVDFIINKNPSVGNNKASARLTGAKLMYTDATNAETSDPAVKFDYMNGAINNANDTGHFAWMFRRAPGFFDVVAYTGTGVARTVPHNLGVAPELMIVKKRSDADEWPVYSSALGTATHLTLNTTSAKAGSSNYWNNTTPTESVFSLSDRGEINASGQTFIAYLFATLPGISKVGSYTGNGSSQTINCGFTGGARFILIKRTDSTGDWYVWDTARGIVAGNDPHLSLNTTAAEVTSDDTIDPDSSGFIVNQVAATNVNVSSASYIYLAIA
jgi:hypothetical protein